MIVGSCDRLLGGGDDRRAGCGGRRENRRAATVSAAAAHLGNRWRQIRRRVPLPERGKTGDILSVLSVEHQVDMVAAIATEW